MILKLLIYIKVRNLMVMLNILDVASVNKLDIVMVLPHPMAVQTKKGCHDMSVFSAVLSYKCPLQCYSHKNTRGS